MATSFQYDCPHCTSKNAAFVIGYQHSPAARPVDNYLTAVCGVCDVPALFWYVDHQRVRLGEPRTLTGSAKVDFPGQHFVIVRAWPELPAGDAPADTPANVANFFKQGTSSLDARNFDAAGTMFRKCLESATKILDPSQAEKVLVKRIDALVNSGSLTSDLGKWAHEVRLGGNDAAHEEDPFLQEEAEDLRNFIENFLRYAFTLPCAVARRINPEVST